MKYKVTIYYQTHIEVEVDAKSENDARLFAYLEAGDKRYDDQLLSHIVAADYSEVEEIKEDK